jgi:hypothetical protein
VHKRWAANDLKHAKAQTSYMSDSKTIRKNHLIPERHAYAAYLSLVRNVSRHPREDANHIHEVEMLLFSLADADIYKDVFNRLSKAEVKNGNSIYGDVLKGAVILNMA